MADFLSLNDRSWLWAASFLYTAGFVFGLTCLVRARAHSRPVLFAVVVTGFVGQTIGLYLRGMEHGGCPLGNPFEIMQFIVWSLILLYMAVGPAFRMSMLGFFSAGLAAFLGVLSLAIPDWDGTRSANVLGPNPWIEVHAALALFSYGVFAILALISVMYLFQNRSLKQKKLQGLAVFLPSILQLDHMIARLLITGVSVLTVSLALGTFYWMPNPGSIEWPKLAVTIAIWIAYLCVACLRWQRKVVAHTLAWTCIILFLVTLASIWPVAGGRFAAATSAPTVLSF